MNKATKPVKLNEVVVNEATLNPLLKLADMFGSIETVLTAPTGKPKNFVNQFKLVTVEGSGTAAGAFITGEIYKITSVGTTDFTAVGATSNTVGVYFVATGAGSGSGSATRYTLRLYVYSPLFDVWRYTALS